MQIYLPLILLAQSFIGAQATISTNNLAEIYSLHSYSIQLNNFHIYEDWQSFQQNSMLVADLHPMVILYFTRDTSDPELEHFCEWAAMNVPADTFQIAQEPDILDGVDGYYGGWGLENINRYVQQFNICSREIQQHSNALVAIGTSTSGDWKEWLTEFLSRSVYKLDVIGIHHYNRYRWYEYNPADLHANISYAASFGYPVWVTEIGYRCVDCVDLNDFYKQQAEFVSKAIPAALQFGAQRVYYYGYNPNWDNVDLRNNPLAVEAFRNLQHR